MKQGDIITVVTMSGEFVGKLSGDIGETISLEDPRMLIQTQEGMGFAAGICVTGVRDPKDVTFKQYVFVTATNQEIQDAYRTAVTGIVI
jgi:hypothetical protein